MARRSVSKHLGVLEGAGLIVTTRQGREKLHHLNLARSATSPIAGSGDITGTKSKHSTT